MLKVIQYITCILFLQVIFVCVDNSKKALADDAQILADFVYDFSSLIIDDRLVCSYGYGDIAVSLADNIRNVRTLSENDLSKANKYCKLIYIGLDKEKYISRVIRKISKTGIPTISFIEDFDEKGTFYIEIGRYGNIVLVFDKEIISSLGVEFSNEIFRFLE